MHDVELGVRIRRGGFRIELDPSIRGTHLKRWTFASLLRSDILCRAVPVVFPTSLGRPDSPKSST